MKGLSARHLHNELVAVLGSGPVAYSAIAKYRRQWNFPAISSEYPRESPRTIIDDTFFDTVDKQPFSSALKLGMLACIPSTMVSRQIA
jgi:hypothetical protein